MTKQITEPPEVVQYRMARKLLRQSTRDITRAFSVSDAAQARRILVQAEALLQTLGAKLQQTPPRELSGVAEDWEARGRALRRWAEALAVVLHLQKPVALQRASRRRKWLRFLGVLGLVFCTIAAGEWQRWFSAEGLEVTYFQDCQLQQPAWRGVEQVLARDFRDRPPIWWIRPAGFSARWSGLLLVPRDDQYTFYAQSCDGLRLYLDDKCIIDNWRDQTWNESGRGMTLQLTQGPHSLVLEHYAHLSRTGAVRVRWCGGGVPENTVLAAPYLRKRP